MLSLAAIGLSVGLKIADRDVEVLSNMRSLLCLTSTIFIAMQLTARADTVLAGTQIQVRPDSEIKVSKWDRGRIYTGYVERDVRAADGDVTIPRGSTVELIVRQVGPERMAIDLESVTVNGRRYVLDSSGPTFHTGEYESGGGLVGAIVGAVAGVRSDGDEIFVPAESVLSFQTRAPLHVVGWQDPGYERDGHHYHRDHDWYR